MPTKVHLFKAMVFPVVVDGCERWAIKKPEHRRIDAFELWCWRRLLRVSWTARISNQSILKEINPEYSLEGLMLKLKLQYFGYLMWRTDSLEKTLMLGKIEGRRRRVHRGWDGWMASPTWWTWVWASSRSWWWTGKPGMLQSMGLQRVGHDWTTELNRTDSTPSSIHGGWFQERLLQGTAETAHSTKHCTCFFLCLSVQSVSHVWLFAYIPMIKFNLQIRQRD